MNVFSEVDFRFVRRWGVFFLIGLLVSLSIVGCQGEEGDGAITASGFIEGDEIIVAAESGGRVVEVLVDEGDDVAVGDPLLRLDDALLQTQRAEAEAAVTMAEANLHQIEAGPRPAEVAAAQAAVAQAQADRDGAEQGLENAREAVDNPQELNADVVAAETRVDLAEQEVELARADLHEAEVLYSVYAEQGGDVEQTWALNVEAVRARLSAAEARLDGARRYLNVLYATRSNPLALTAELHGAEAEAEIASAAVDEARAALDELEAGATSEEIAVAQAQLHQAQATRLLVDAQLRQLSLTSPITGFVSSRSIHVGETASPGSTLLTLVNLDNVTLVVYIPETQIGRVHVGQSVEVMVDSFPGRAFLGQVATIATEAEFTPRNVQTQEERVNLVFAVKVVIPNPDHDLKPGMPADAVIGP